MIFILVIALLVLGPKRLPELARSLGRGLAEFRKATADVTEEIDNARVLLEEQAREASGKTYSRGARPQKPENDGGDEDAGDDEDDD